MCRAPEVLRCSVRSLLSGYILPVGWLVLAAAIARARQFNLKPGVTLAHVPLHFFKCAPGYPDLSVMYGWIKRHKISQIDSVVWWFRRLTATRWVVGSNPSGCIFF